MKNLTQQLNEWWEEKEQIPDEMLQARYKNAKTRKFGEIWLEKQIKSKN